MRIGGAGAPGVFVRGLETAPLPPLAGAVTGFVGLPRRGPGDAPQALRSWGDYLTVFGTASPWGYLGDSAFAFFANRAWTSASRPTTRRRSSTRLGR